MLNWMATSNHSLDVSSARVKSDRYLLQKSDRLLLQMLMCQFKHPAFRAEQEIRCLVGAASPDPFQPYERFRATPDGRIVPYVVVVSTRSRTDLLPIREVVCGPSSDPHSEASVRRLLRANGYENVEVSTSSVPFR